MNIPGDTVTFRSADEWYEIEQRGDRPVTLRLMTRAEFAELTQAAPTRIVIRHVDGDRSFEREIRSIHNVTGVLGDAVDALGDRVLVEICWRHLRRRAEVLGAHGR